MLRKRYISLLPTEGTTAKEQLNSCLVNLPEILDTNKYQKTDVVKQSLFLRACDNEDFLATIKEIFPLLSNFYGSSLPPTSYLGQPPENKKHVAMELTVINSPTEDIEIKRSTLGNLRYSIVRIGDFKEIHAAGLTDYNLNKKTADLSEEAFSYMKDVLDQEGMTFSDVVRQWNYIEDIVGTVTDPGSIRQNYQEFNDVRSQYYQTSDFKNGYPSATGIGMNTGGVVIEFIAVSPHKDITILPLSNPRQVDAHVYSEKVLVGDSLESSTQKASPKFERAKLVFSPHGSLIFISGTAAILGQATSKDNNVENQTQTTIDNILALVSRENIKDSGFREDITVSSPSFIRVYVKEESKISVVKNICEDHFGQIPSLYLVSDICREDLLVEIEGVLDLS